MAGKRVALSFETDLEPTPFAHKPTVCGSKLIPTSSSPQRQEEQHRHRPSPWRVMYNLFMGLLPLPRDPGAPEMEPN